MNDNTCYESCTDESVSFAEDVQKVNYMALGKGGYEGEALNIDEDPDTCAPQGDCENGYDNQLSGLLQQVSAWVNPDEELANALDEGKLILLSEAVNLDVNGEEFTINMYAGEPVADKEACDYQTEKCQYCVRPEALDVASNCKPLIFFDNAKIENGVLSAGGKDSIFVLTIPISEGISLQVSAVMAQFRGDVTLDGDKIVKVENGVLGAAIPKEAMMEAIDNLPPDVVEELPVDIDTIKGILDMFIQNDVDVDGDGEPDAASIGIKFASIEGTIVGLCEVEAE